jgi:acyl transferase domain-containing protein
VPLNRWDVDKSALSRGSLPKRFGAFLSGAELFDSAFFSIPATEVCPRSVF